MNDSLAARVQRLEDLMAIHQLFIDYGEHLDAGNFDAYADLFAADGEVLLGPLGRAKGREAIKALMTEMLADRVGTTYHLISSPRVVLDGDRATSTVMWTVLARSGTNTPEIPSVGRHVDELVRTAEGWRFQRRKGLVHIPSVGYRR